MIVEFEAARWIGEAWVPAEIVFTNVNRDQEIEMFIDGERYRHFAEEMADGLALMLVRKEREE